MLGPGLLAERKGREWGRGRCFQLGLIPGELWRVNCIRQLSQPEAWGQAFLTLESDSHWLWAAPGGREQPPCISREGDSHEQRTFSRER